METRRVSSRKALAIRSSRISSSSSLTLFGISSEMDHLGMPPAEITASIRNYKKSTQEVGPCNPPYAVDPRTHLNGPFVSVRKVQKQMELARLETLECRRFKLKSLIQKDRDEYMSVLLEQGLTLYTDTLW